MGSGAGVGPALGTNEALTFSTSPIHTTHAPVPVHAPDHPANW